MTFHMSTWDLPMGTNRLSNRATPYQTGNEVLQQKGMHEIPTQSLRVIIGFVNNKGLLFLSFLQPPSKLASTFSLRFATLRRKRAQMESRRSNLKLSHVSGIPLPMARNASMLLSRYFRAMPNFGRR